MSDLAVAAIRDELDDLCWRYADVLDEGRLEDWPELFVEEGSYRVLPRANVDRGLPLATMRCDGRAMMRDRVYALRSANFYVARRIRHVVGAWRAVPDAPADPALSTEGLERWSVRSSFSVFETLARTPTIVLAVGEYRDIVVRDLDGVLRFAERLVLNDSDLVPNSLVFPL